MSLLKKLTKMFESDNDKKAELSINPSSIINNESQNVRAVFNQEKLEQDTIRKKQMVHPDVARILWIANGNQKNYIQDSSRKINISINYAYILCENSSSTLNEPSLIYVDLPVDETTTTSSFPSCNLQYKEMTPAQRGAYWSFLKNPYSSYNEDYSPLPIFLCGVERHLILGNYKPAVDTTARMIDYYKDNLDVSQITAAVMISCIIHKERNMATSFLERILDGVPYFQSFPLNKDLFLLTKYELDIPMTARDVRYVTYEYDCKKREEELHKSELVESKIKEIIQKKIGKTEFKLSEIAKVSSIENCESWETDSFFRNESLATKVVIPRLTKCKPIYDFINDIKKAANDEIDGTADRSKAFRVSDSSQSFEEAFASLQDSSEEDQLRFIENTLLRRYGEIKARSLMQVKDDNPDIPFGKINPLTRAVFNQTAKERLVDIGVIFPIIEKPVDNRTSEEKLDDLKEILVDRYKNRKKESTLKELFKNNPDINFNPVNSWTREAFDITARQFYVQIGVMTSNDDQPVDNRTSEEKLNDLEAVLIERYKYKPKAKTLRDITESNPDINFNPVNSWAREAFDITARQFYVQIGVMTEEPVSDLSEPKDYRNRIKEIDSMEEHPLGRIKFVEWTKDDDSSDDVVAAGEKQRLDRTKVNIEAAEELGESNLEELRIKSVLAQHYTKGFRLHSRIELRKLRRAYEDMFSKSIDEVDDDNLKLLVEKSGILYDGIVYLPSSMMSQDLHDSIYNYIQKSFDSGKKAIFYEALYESFSSKLLDSCVYNPEMLREYLSQMSDGTYYSHRRFISRDQEYEFDTHDEIKRVLENHGVPMSYDEIQREIAHVPVQQIKTALALNEDFISDGSKRYFYIDSVAINDKDLERIIEIIQNNIDSRKYLSGTELIKAMKASCPELFERNIDFSDLGIRNALAYTLSNEYSFNGNIISDKTSQLSMSDVYVEFCRTHERFTLSELNVLKQEMGSTIYFDAVYENSLRISEEEFVSSDMANFDVSATDRAIDRFCPGEYIAIADVTQFGSFPEAGFPWTHYLLEHYVSCYSEKYCLMHGTFNANACVGAIVKRGSKIKDYNDVLSYALADGDVELKNDKALQYLYDKGFIARRKLADIETVLINAREIRNKKGMV